MEDRSLRRGNASLAVLHAADLEKQFDALGSEGWELSWILMEQALQHEKDSHVVIFKRPLPD